MERSLLSPTARFLLVETTGTMVVCVDVSSGDSLPLVFSRSVDNKSWTDRDHPDSAVDEFTRAPSETETTGRDSSSPSPPLFPVGGAC